jgi:hypothetical protein
MGWKRMLQLAKSTRLSDDNRATSGEKELDLVKHFLDHPFGKSCDRPTWRRLLNSKHARDLRVAALIILGILAVGLYLLMVRRLEPVPAVTLIVAAAAGWRYLYDLGNRRIGMVDAITSDILSIGRVFLSADIINSFVRLAQAGYQKLPISGTEETEDYFDLYRSYLTDIGTLDSESVRHVTACYTFLKASRDFAIPLKQWKGSGDPMKKDEETTILNRIVVHVIYQCLLFAANAQSALLNLRDDDDEGRQASAVFSWSFKYKPSYT